jgi:pimeloyl-ACP methyl ester carboxylesterase
MLPTLRTLSLLTVLAQPVETQFEQVAPVGKDGPRAGRALRHDRAVVLLHGLYVHPFSQTNVTRAQLHSWQKPGSLLVKRLAEEADVFAFAYAQTVPADEVAARSDLGEHVRRLRERGYREVVLLGHSAGGLVAREFVEDCPDAGVTKVIQVCTPNAGSGWALVQAVRANQIEFLDSLTKAARQRAAQARAGKKVPPGVEFVCVVGTGTVVGDGLVACRCQWPEDLQQQGVPAVSLVTNHWLAVRGPRGVDLLARLVREPQPRWDGGHVAAARHRLLGQ